MVAKTPKALPKCLENLSRKPTGEILSLNLYTRVKGVSAPERVCYSAFLPDGRHAVAVYNYKVVIWDLSTAKPERSWKAHKRAMCDAALFGGGRLLITAGELNKDYDTGKLALKMWDLRTGKLVRRFPFHPRGWPLFAVAVSSDEKWVVGIQEEGLLQRWDLKTGRLLECTGPWSYGTGMLPFSLAFSPDGSFLFVGDILAGPVLFDLQCDPVDFDYLCERRDVKAATFSPDSRYLLTAWNEPAIRMFDLGTRKEKLVLDGHEGDVRAVAFSPDGRFALSGGADKAVRFWDLRRGVLLRRLDGHEEAIRTVSFSQDGRYALSGAGDGLRVWDLKACSGRRSLDNEARQQCLSREHNRQLLEAAKDKDLKALKEAVRAGADLETMDSERNRPVELAIQHHFLAGLRFLLDSLEGTHPSEDLDLLLRLAINYGFLPGVKLLIAKGGDPLMAFGKFDPAFRDLERRGLEYARFEQLLLRVFVYLLELGLDPNAPDGRGRTPMYKAARHCSPAVPLLLARGADPNARDNWDVTPFHLACAHPDLEAVQLMLKHGADLCAADKEGLTPLDYAVMYRNEDIVQHLRALGAKSGKSE
jgi:WD40 repeat protein